VGLEKRKKAHLDSAKKGSNLYFHKALRKYGPENFEWHGSIRTKTLEDLYNIEIRTIANYEDWQTYNISAGGEHPAYGMKHTEETKVICGEHAKRRWDGKRALDKYPMEAYLCSSYKEARLKYGIPKTTWYRTKKLLDNQDTT
jgi:hypothetical protein